jgi:hypothetical protein
MRFVQDHRKGVREPEPCAILLDLHLPVTGYPLDSADPNR